MEVLKYSRSTILRLPSVYGENNKKGLVFHILDTIKEPKSILFGKWWYCKEVILEYFGFSFGHSRINKGRDLWDIQC